MGRGMDGEAAASG